MPDDIKPWTVKGVSPETRNAAIAAAQREGMVMGEWLARAILGQVQAERNAKGPPAVIETSASTLVSYAAPTVVAPALDQVRAVVAQLAELAPQLDHAAIPMRLQRKALRLLDQQMTALLPPPQRRGGPAPVQEPLKPAS